MNEITRIITPCRCGKCIYCEFGGNPPAQIIEKETVCGDCERKSLLIEQMREALKWALTEARSTHCEQLIKAALEAAERAGK